MTAFFNGIQGTDKVRGLIKCQQQSKKQASSNFLPPALYGKKGKVGVWEPAIAFSDQLPNCLGFTFMVSTCTLKLNENPVSGVLKEVWLSDVFKPAIMYSISLWPKI